MNHLLHGTTEMYSKNDDYVFNIVCDHCDESRENHLVKQGLWKDKDGEVWDGHCCSDCQKENTEISNEEYINNWN